MKPIVLKLGLNNTLTKLTNVNPTKGSNQEYVYFLYAPWGTDAVKIKYLPLRFYNLTGKNPVPGFKMYQQTDQEVIDAIVPEGNVELGWSLFYLPVTSGISGLIQSFNNSGYKVSFERLALEVDPNNIGSYATESTNQETIDTELKAQFPDALEDEYVNVYGTTSNVYSSWLYDGQEWSPQNKVLNETLIDTSQAYEEVFKGTVFANEDYTTDYDPSDLAIQFNHIYSELAEINDLIQSLIGGETSFMQIGDYDTENTATKSVKFARNIKGTIDTKSGDEVINHIDSKLNPHEVTKAQVGLSEVDNTSDADKPISDDTQTALDLKEDKANKSQPNGYASLDGAGKVPASELPSYVDDVIEVPTYADLPATGETGIIYVVIADETSGGNTSTYRWATTVYVMISNTLSSAEVKALYEANANTNAYTDVEEAKVANVPSDTSNEIAKINCDIKFKFFTQDTTDKYKFYTDCTNTDLTDKRVIYAEVSTSIVEDPTFSYVMFSVDNGVTYKNIYNLTGNEVTLAEAFKRGEKIQFEYSTTLNGWQPLWTNRDFQLLSGIGWTNESTKNNNDLIQATQATQDDILSVISAGGSTIAQRTLVTIATAGTSTATKLIFDTIEKASNDISILTIDVNADTSNDQKLLDENVDGFNIVGKGTFTSTAGFFTTSTVLFTLLVNGVAKDSFSISTTTLGGTKTDFTQFDYVAQSTSDILTITAQITSGSGIIEEFNFYASTNWTTTGGIPAPSTTSVTTISTPSTEMLTPISGGKQQDANEQFVSKLNEVGKAQSLVEVGLGQFKIDSNNPIASMNLYTFQFPTATADSDLDVEVSVDNGVTFYDVEFKNTEWDLQVENVTGQILNLVFDGTRFIASYVDTPLQYDNLPYIGDSAWDTPKTGVAVVVGETILNPEPDVEGLTYAQIVENGDTQQTYTTALEDGEIKILPDGTWELGGLYDANAQTHPLINGNEYICIVKYTPTVGRLQDRIVVRYSNGSFQSIGTPSDNTSGLIIQKITANATLLANIKLKESSTTAGNIEKKFQILIPVPTKLQSLTDAQILKFFSGAKYIPKGLHTLEGLEIVSNYTNLFNKSNGFVISGSDIISGLQNISPNKTYKVNDTTFTTVYLWFNDDGFISSNTALTATSPSNATMVKLQLVGTNDITLQDTFILSLSSYTGPYVPYKAPVTYKLNTPMNSNDTREVIGDGVETGVSGTATINDTLLPLIKAGSEFNAVDEVTGDTYIGTVGDTLAFSNTATVIFKLATPIPRTEALDESGQLLVSEYGTYTQGDKYGVKTEFSVTVGINTKSQVNANTGAIVDIVKDVTALDTRVTANEAEIEKLTKITPLSYLVGGLPVSFKDRIVKPSKELGYGTDTPTVLTETIYNYDELLFKVGGTYNKQITIPIPTLIAGEVKGKLIIEDNFTYQTDDDRFYSIMLYCTQGDDVGVVDNIYLYALSETTFNPSYSKSIYTGLTLSFPIKIYGVKYGSDS